MDDSRYDAVGSSSLREELFDSYLKANGAISNTAAKEPESSASHDTSRDEDGRVGALEEAHGYCRIVCDRVGQDGEQDEADGTAADSAACHDALANFRHRTPSSISVMEAAGQTN